MLMHHHNNKQLAVVAAVNGVEQATWLKMIQRPALALMRKAIIAAWVVLRERLVLLAGVGLVLRERIVLLAVNGVVQQYSLIKQLLEMVINKVKSLAAWNTIKLVLVGETATIMNF